MVSSFFHQCRQMDVEPAMKHLESFVELSKKSGNTVEQQRACSSLGEMLNSMVSFNFVIQK